MNEELEQNEKDDVNPQDSGFRKYITQRNVIIAICVLFAIWILFCDRNSFIKQYQLNKEQNKLIETKKDYQMKIKETQKEINALDDNAYIERIAREKHLMKKDNEDIYIIND
ncbi:MAG: septum formation initiator family protein [Bacteroidales bacterium]|nr:septum formation initiator family protein [Bacteroidales bacterium]